MAGRKSREKILGQLNDFDPEKAYARQERTRKALLEDPANQERLTEVKRRLELAEQLYLCRKKANLTQKELAEKLNTTQSTIARTESGKGNITIDKLLKFAAACGKKVALI